jgi:hypothetical protein
MGVLIKYNGLGGKLRFYGASTGGFKARYVSSASPLLLDTYPGAAVAYSLRKLSSTYNGSAIRVRRSSDNTEQDIGFVSNELDTATLLTFCGLSNGFVTTWYDQSGNSVNAIQSTAANQPRIITTGTIETQSSKPTIYFFNSNNLGLTTTLNVTNPFSIISIISQNLSNTAANRIFQSSTNNSLISIKRSDNLSIYTGGTVLSNFPSQVSNQAYIISFLRQSSTSYIYQNNSSVSNSSTLSTDWGIFTISGQGVYAGEPSLSKISELIIYSSNQNSNISGINTNINSYYSIY